MKTQRIMISYTDKMLLSVFMGEDYPTEIDFNLLMPVVEKIESMEARVTIEWGMCIIEYDGYYKQNYEENNKLGSILYTIIEFLRWYNKSKT